MGMEMDRNMNMDFNSNPNGNVNILVLYYDLLNLYGESGNIRGIRRHLEDQGLEVRVTAVTVIDDFNQIDFGSFDFIYAGSGTEINQKRALAHLRPFGPKLKQAAEAGTVMVFTGNSCELLGKSIEDASGKVHEGIGLLDFTTVEHGGQRFAEDVICGCDFLAEKVIGFTNRCSQTSGVTASLFHMERGAGDSAGCLTEGFRVNNVFGTHLIGPVFIKNPSLMRYLVNCVGKRARGVREFVYQAVSYPYEERAYEVTLSQIARA